MPATDLPYYCPEFRSGHLKPPCNGKLARIKELQEKGQNYLGTLDKCQECQGRKLEERTAEETPMAKGLKVEKGFCSLHPEEDHVILEPRGKDVGGKPTGQCRSCHQGLPPTPAPDNPTEGYPEEEGERETVAVTTGERRTVILQALDTVIKRYGQATRRALAEELKITVPTLRNWLKPLEEGGYIAVTPGDRPTAPALIDFAGPKNNGELAAAAETSEVPEVSEAPEDVKAQKVAAPEGPPVSLPVRPVPRLCKECGVEPEKIDSLNRPMAVCGKCLAKRGKKNLELGSQHGWLPFNIPLNDPKYAEIKKWLVRTAEDYEQELPKAVMYRLKLAYMAIAEPQVDQ